MVEYLSMMRSISPDERDGMAEQAKGVFRGDGLNAAELKL
jgi:hypothetical protein